MQESNPIRGTLFLYIGSFLGMAIGLLYWIIIGRFTNPDMVGQASAAVTIMTLASTIASLGIAGGLPRFLGRTAGSADYRSFKRYIRAAVTILSLSSTLVGIGLVLASPVFVEELSFSIVMISAIVVTVILAGLSHSFQAGLVSLLRTDHVAANTITGNLSRIAGSLFLVFLGFGVLGIFLGYTIMNLVLLVMSATSLQYVLRGREDGIQEPDSPESHRKEIFIAGLPSYVPAVVAAVGTQIGTLLVFGATDAAQTGFYYLSMQIYTAVMIAPSVIMTLLFPYISANPDRDAEITSRSIKYALVPSFPLVSLMLLYPFLPLGLMGDTYIPASPILQVFALNIVPVAVTAAIIKLGYARGNYRMVLAIGLLANVPRMVFYFVLTPLFGSIGAVIAFLIGSGTGLCAALVAAFQLRMTIDRSLLTKMALPPLVLLVLLHFTGLHWLIGIPLVLLITGVAYARLGVLARDETIRIGQAMLPSEIIQRLGPHMMRVLQLVYGE